MRTAAGPMPVALALSPGSPAPASGGSGAVLKAVAAAAAPEPLRNCRRDNPLGPFLLCPCGSFMLRTLPCECSVGGRHGDAWIASPAFTSSGGDCKGALG